MNRFVEWFCEMKADDLANQINKYAKINNLQIISLSTSDSLHSAIVLFEGEKPKYRC